MAIRRSPDSRQSSPTAPSAKKRAPARTPSGDRSRSATGAPNITVTDEVRRQMIAEAAYLRAEQRGFAPGHEAEDWLLAEREVDALLFAKHGAAPQ
jgi:hypothetical protein